MTDVKTGWTIHFSLMNKAATWVVHALDKAVSVLPMGLKGIHSDTGSEFINKPVDQWCLRHGVDFSIGLRPGRPIHKNDNCYAGQKNYATVRKIAGYFRYEGKEGTAALALKEAADLVEQKQNMDRAGDKLLNCAQDVPVLPHRGKARHG
jgi:hypothetical protein